jgi:hypothetical protein
LNMGPTGAQRSHWKAERDAIDRLVEPGGVVVSLGWNTCGMGKKRGYEKEELLVVCHGSGHNDTLVLVERKA